MHRRIIVSLIALVSMAGSLFVPGSASAAPVDAPVTCAATATLTSSGLLFTLVPTLGDPILEFLQTAELPIPIPMDFTGTPEIYSGGTIGYQGTFTIDAGTALDTVLDDFLRPALVQAGYPDLAASLYVVLEMADLRLPFPHPSGTTGVGTPVVTAGGSGVAAAHVGDEMVMTIDEITIDSRVTSVPIELGASYQVKDGGAVPPATITQGIGDLTFDLDLTIGGSAVVPPLPFAIPISGTASGPWGCTPDDPPPVLATTSVIACDTGFSDVPAEHLFCQDIDWLAASGVTTGFPDGTYRPVEPVTRGSMAAFLYRYAGEPPYTPPVVASFPDVPLDHSFFTEIEWLADTGITGGFDDGTFRPADQVTRQSMAAFLYRDAGEPPFTAPSVASFSDVLTNHAFFDEIEWLADTGVTGGFVDGTFRPGSSVTRQSMAAFLHRYDAL